MEHISKILTGARRIEPNELALPVCPECDGNEEAICAHCGGTGGIDWLCGYCDAKGVSPHDCDECDGTGHGRCECGELVTCHIETVFGRRAVCDECAAEPVDPLNEIACLVQERERAQRLERDLAIARMQKDAAQARLTSLEKAHKTVRRHRGELESEVARLRRGAA